MENWVRRPRFGATVRQKSSGMLVSDRPGDTDVFGEVEAFNDHGKVMGGLHETFLGVRFNDPTLCKVSRSCAGQGGPGTGGPGGG